ncbi:hypothetical protein BHE74_00024569 [Ensete ventricosum]|nr:hypothetical protein GW17_00053113 [Ensete ventricosum]RWW67944.1 hypothetical protein BHE74_00024569 [Ensete ventricosum]
MKPAVSVTFLLFLVLLLSASRSQGTFRASTLSSKSRRYSFIFHQSRAWLTFAFVCLVQGPECWKKSRWLPCTAKAMSVASRYCVHCGISDYFQFTDTVSGKSNDVGADSAQNNQKHSKDEADRSQDDIHTAPPASKRPPTYPDILDIAGMDYSPAKRKPPIHN